VYITTIQSVTCHVGSYGVTCHSTQVNMPCINTSQAGQYSIYLAWRDGRLSWPGSLVMYRDNYPSADSHPSKSVTGPNVGQLCWSDKPFQHLHISVSAAQSLQLKYLNYYN